MQTFRIANLKIMSVRESTESICYILYPLDCLGEWIEQSAKTFGVSIAAITGMDWNDDLTPWPAKGEPPGSPDFRGNASGLLATLIGEVIPETERRLNITAEADRTLTGVSLSGLFTLWQWMGNNTFHNIICLSGSFWYDGFVDWLKAQPIPKKTGKAYFLLGNQEAKTNVRAFQPVQTDTMEIVRYLQRNGIEDCFELVPGNHYQYGEQRLNRGLSWMYRSES